MNFKIKIANIIKHEPVIFSYFMILVIVVFWCLLEKIMNSKFYVKIRPTRWRGYLGRSLMIRLRSFLCSFSSSSSILLSSTILCLTIQTIFSWTFTYPLLKAQLQLTPPFSAILSLLLLLEFPPLTTLIWLLWLPLSLILIDLYLLNISIIYFMS